MLRLKGITNLGEIAMAYVEASGQMSVFTLESPRVGLPLIPARDDPDENAIRSSAELQKAVAYACTHCGLTGSPPPTSDEGCCQVCGHSAWVPACMGPADPDLGAIKLNGKGSSRPLSRPRTA